MTRQTRHSTNQHGQRYTAVNVTNATVELRFFRGSLKEDVFWKVIETSVAAYEYIHASTKHTTDGFCLFVESKRERFPHLYSFLVVNNLLVSPTYCSYENQD